VRFPWLHGLDRCRSDPTDKNRVKNSRSLREDAILLWNQWFVKKITSPDRKKASDFSAK